MDTSNTHLASYKASLKSYQIYPSEPAFLNKNRKALDPRGLHVIFKDVLKRQAYHLPASSYITYGILLQH
ncbi:hypothetical protein B1B04_17105 [Lysinibacillus sp. KCTC 33748]|uniref:hypothetical protein n=1 Tax=unclassified Lysinibacillus TaxID=2636778 RepID=UPI0009A6A77D|nr:MULTISPECIES: hypothetical protein [unclassified Lysinibacillus]OXS72218.1 hypothetical protein B1B04_17105 [Lysinibacillus sp. KCTC 33748]